jgi:CheY-like chemotaxis protein
MGDRSFKNLRLLLKQKDHDLVILCLKIFSRTLPYKIVSQLFPILDDKMADHGIKFSVYQLLGNFPRLDSAVGLVKGTLDSAMTIRMAAIRVLDKNMTDFVASEIKKKIESGTKSATLLAESILDMEAKNLIYFLLGSDTFSYMASNYFSKPVTGSVIEAYISMLEKRKLNTTARKYRDIARENMNRTVPRIAVVSASELILKVYAKLITTAGFRPLVFHSPQDAFEAILDQKPGLLITDLFLNDMTGFEFVREIRGVYSGDDLPVVVSSLQKQFIRGFSGQKKPDTDVHALYEFPMKSSQIKSWIKI